MRIQKKVNLFLSLSLSLSLSISLFKAYSNETDLIPKNSRVFIKRILKNVMPVKGGSIEITRQEQEENMINKMKQTLLNEDSNEDSSSTASALNNNILSVCLNNKILFFFFGFCTKVKFFSFLFRMILRNKF
jgi:hypothetical protein